MHGWTLEPATSGLFFCLYGPMAKQGPPYTPPDPTEIEVKPQALDYWARTLETNPEKIRQAVQKVGPSLEKVKLELGIGGAG
jgi:hypothetical protein